MGRDGMGWGGQRPKFAAIALLGAWGEKPKADALRAMPAIACTRQPAVVNPGAAPGQNRRNLQVPAVAGRRRPAVEI